MNDSSSDKMKDGVKCINPERKKIIQKGKLKKTTMNS